MRRSNLALLIICIIVRLCCTISKESYYVADEYWQSLEVAHKLVFGYGYLTWEWVHAIRSYIYVGWIAAVYQFLKYYQWDSPDLVAYLPCYIQAIFSAFADTYFISWVYKVSNKRQAYWSSWCYMTNVFLAYCAARTLTNTFETNLTCIALYYYPWMKSETGNTKYFWIVCLVCLVKPTAALIWLPLCCFAIYESNHPIKLVFTRYFPIGLMMLQISTLIDSYFYGAFVLTWWNFFKFNLVYDVSSFYSTQFGGWYLFIGLPVVLGPCIVPFYIAMASKLRDNWEIDSIFYKVATSVVFTIVVYSWIPHKEFRFVLPLVPLMTFIASYAMYKWTSWMNKYVSISRQGFTIKRISINCISFAILVVNLYAFFYLSQFHQVAPIRVMKYLRDPSNHLLFLMPCHSTPLYSHLHVDIQARFLRCDPNLDHVHRYRDESDKFYHDPITWLRNEYGLGRKNKRIGEVAEHFPTHVILFDILLPDIEIFLSNYEKVLSLYHATIIPPKVGNYLFVYQRKKKQLVPKTPMYVDI